MSNRKRNVALLSVGSNSVLIILKLIIGIISGSVSIISEAIHSMMDWIASVIAFVSINISGKSPDKEHPYGHEKAENISGVIEGILIMVASIWIIYEAVIKLIDKKPIESMSLGIGILVMFISAVINIIVSKKLYKVAKEEDSVALEADALHLKADVYTSLGVGVGLLLIWITGYHFLDPIVAMLVAVFIMKEAIELIKNAFSPLMDHKLSDEEEQIVKDAIEVYRSKFINYHDLRTRKSGKIRHIDFHLVFHKFVTLKDAHDMCDKIEDEIKNKISDSRIIIHPEVCDEKCNCK